jgi:Mycothiol maleylpyruvate isomerase N-terminal domain
VSVSYGQVPQLVPMSAAGVAYRLVCERVDGLVRGRDGIANLPVPACPGWTIRQVVAHLAGVAQDIVSLNLEQKGTGALGGRTGRATGRP